MKRIICIGNRYIEEDSLGARVFDLLSVFPLPEDVQVIEGGLAGLNLLPLLDNCESIVFVDALAGAAGVQVWPGEAIEISTHYGHADGLGYLLGAFFALEGRRAGQVYIVGAGNADLAEDVSRVAMQVALAAEMPIEREEVCS